MKILGLLLVMITGLGIGWNIKQSQNKRIRSLEWFERFLECAAERVRFMALPISDLLQELSALEEFSHFSLLQAVCKESNFKLAWQRELENFSVEFSLSPREKEIFTDFMNGFGKTDVFGEVRYCEQYRSMVHRCIEEIRDELRVKGQLYVTLGFCGGGLVGLLFL